MDLSLAVRVIDDPELKISQDQSLFVFKFK